MKDTANIENKKVIAISISTGWAVRNFFQTGIIEKWKSSFKILIITTPSIHSNLIKQGYGEGILFEIVEDSAEPVLWRLFRQIKKKLYMESRKSSTEAIWAKYVSRPFYQKIGGYIIPCFLKFVEANRLLDIVESIDFAINNRTEIDRIFHHHEPVIFFATHASTYFEESLLHSAVAADTPSVFMVLSWDHLSSKVVLSSKYRSVYVWNKITKDEILHTCPAYSNDSVHVVGVPQYDVYAEKPALNYSQWCQKYGLNPEKKTILFSTMPQVRHEQQHIILEHLLQHISENEQLDTRYQVLIKCHPFDNEGKYEYLIERYKVGICRSTLSVGLSHALWFPSFEEMVVGRDALYYSDININIFSTVTLEASYFDKPIIHIAFDPELVENRIPCKEYYQFEHFKKITEMKASIMVYSFSELYSAIEKYSLQPEHKCDERRNLVKEYFSVPSGSASENVVKHLMQDIRNTER